MCRYLLNLNSLFLVLWLSTVDSKGGANGNKDYVTYCMEVLKFNDENVYKATSILYNIDSSHKSKGLN